LHGERDRFAGDNSVLGCASKFRNFLKFLSDFFSSFVLRLQFAFAWVIEVFGAEAFFVTLV
jgi:hypothetical protein